MKALLLSVCLGLSSLVSLAQTAPEGIWQGYDGEWKHVSQQLIALAEATPADKFAWRPAPGVRSVSEALMHIASAWSFYAPRSIAGKEPADFGVPREKLAALEKITAKSDVIDQLEKAWVYGRAQVAAADPSQLTGKYKPWGVTLDQAAFAMTDDLHEHLGQLIAYARSIGVKPPWSK